MNISTSVAAGLAAASLFLAGCAGQAGPQTASAAPIYKSATARLVDGSGNAMGTATLFETAHGLRVQARVVGAPAGVHGIHLHMVGRCDGPGFTSAGGHWNPTGKMHGMQAPGGHHLGDLPNITIGDDGTGSVDFVIGDGRLRDGDNALLDADGAAIVLHAQADDERTDPSGASGARIACGVISGA